MWVVLLLVDPVWGVGWEWVSVERGFEDVDAARRSVHWFLEKA